MSILDVPRNSRIVVDANGIHVVADAGDPPDAERAYAQRSQRISDAWRGPDRAVSQTLDAIKRKRQLAAAWKHDAADADTSDADAFDAETAYASRKARLATAWQSPVARPSKVREQPGIAMTPGGRKPKPGLPGYDSTGGRDGNTRDARPVAGHDVPDRSHYQRDDDDGFHFDDDAADAQAVRDAAYARSVERVAAAGRKP